MWLIICVCGEVSVLLLGVKVVVCIVVGSVILNGVIYVGDVVLGVLLLSV